MSDVLMSSDALQWSPTGTPLRFVTNSAALPSAPRSRYSASETLNTGKIDRS